MRLSKCCIMGESRIDMPQTPQVTEKAEDEGGKGTQSISSIPQTPQVTEKTEDEGGKTIHSMLKRGKAIFSSMLKGGKGIFSMQKSIVNRPGSSQPPEKANYQVAIPAQSNNVPHMFPLGLFHRLPDRSKNIESEFLVWSSDFEELVKNMIGDTPKIRLWYDGVERRLSESNTELGRMMDRYSDEELGRMMARSGLLLLEFLRFLADLPLLRSWCKELFESSHRQLSEAVIKIDNRIPIFVLKKILEWERVKERVVDEAATDLDCILKHAWLKLSPIQYDIRHSHVIAGVPLKDDSHLWEFVYENIIGSSDFKHAYNWRKIKRRVRHISLLQAEQLQGEGVKFAPNEGLLNKICFNRTNRTLYLPTIKMDGGTAAVLRKLVLFEASKQGKESQPLMSYVNLMDRLIDTAEDVLALVEGGIIHCNLGSNVEVVHVWNGLRRLLPNKKIKYEPIDNAIYDVTRFYTSHVESCRIMYTEFKQSYCSKPWIVLSVISACILFALTTFQTYLAWEQVRLQRESMPKT